jgi:GH18 family chitinase
MYVPANYIAHGAPWTYGGFEDQSFFYIIDSSNTHEFYLDFQQDTTNRNNILIYADTATGYPSNNTSITITRGSAIQIELYYKVGSPAKLWVAPIDSSFSSSSPTFTLPDSPMVPLNGEIIYGLGWSDLGSSPIYVNNFAVDSAFIPDTYINQPMATYLWGNLDQSVSSNIAYGSNIPIIGLNDSCLAHGIKPKLSIGGWPGAYTGLTADSTVGVTTWTSNTPWNFMMKDTTSSWLDANSITRNTGLRGHWIYNLIKLFEKTAFVGVDFDFEYVGMDTIGLAAKYQAKLFPDFLQAVRNSFDTAGHPTWSLTFCAPIPWGNTFPDTAYSADTNAYGHYYWMGSGSPLVAADSILWGNFDDRWMDWNRFYSTCDEIHLMTYGFSGIWDPHNSFNGAIWKTPPGVNGNYFCMDEVDSVITARGFSKVKTSIGFGFFGTVWLHNSDLWEPIGGLYNNDPPYGKGTWATTVTIGNSDLLYPNSYSGDWTSLKQLGATYGWCNTFAQPFYKYNIPGAPITFPQCGIDSLEHGTAAASSDFIVSYDDSLSTSLRMKWAYNKGYKSIFIWEITQDFEPDANGVLRPALEDAMAANITPFIPPLAWLPVLLVSNHAPTPPVTYPRAQLISPVNINTDQEPIFSWHPDSGATGYDLQVASDTLFSNSSLVINVLNLQDTTYASMFETFTQGQNYYWRVKSILSNTLVNSLIDNFSIINTNSSAVLTPSLLTLTSTPVGNKFKITVPWTIWYVSNQGYEPTSARVYLNGVLVAQQDSNFQFSSYTMTPDTLTATVGWGKYLVYLVTYNMFGEQIAMNYDSIFTGSSGAPMQPDVSYINIISDHPSISIDSAGCEGDVIVIQDSTTYNFCLQSPGAIGTFTVLNKDLSFFSTFSLSGNILTVRATRGGLTGLEIQYSQNGLVRYVGLAVKDWTGTIPKFPPYVSIGGLTQFYSAALPFYKDIRNGNADDNKRFDQGAGYYYYYGYLTDGHLDIFIRQSLRFGLYPGFTWYNINEGNDSPAGVVYGLTDTSSTGLPEYYTGLKGMLQHCDSIMHGVPLFLTLEPDMIGYLKIGYTSTYLLSSFTCKVNQAYSTGVLTTGVDPAFPNDLTGFCKSLNYIIKKYYPPSCIGWAFPQWACTHNVNKGIMHATDSGYPSGGNYSTGRTLIQNDFLELSSISITLGLNYLTDWMNIEGYGYDGALGSGGSNSVNWTNPDTTSWFWNAQYYDNLILAAHTMNLPISSGGTGLPVILGGDAGHIDSSLTKSPYNSNGSFANLTDSFFQWEDAASDYFFGDSMSISSGNRLNYFSVQPPADPADIIVSGNSVIWNQHLTYAKNNGVIGVMFGAGMTVDTHNLPDGTGASPNNIPTDNYWWITKVQRYYQNPVYK